MDAEEPGDVGGRAACIQHGEDLGLLLGESLGCRPPRGPWARAERRPAWVRPRTMRVLDTITKLGRRLDALSGLSRVLDLEKRLGALDPLRHLRR